MTGLARWVCTALWGLSVLAAGCRRGSDELASLEGKQGTVERDEAKEPGSWAVAGVGDAFRVGDGLRTASGAGAKLRLSDGSGMALREKTLLRFLATPPSKKRQGFDIQTGEVELDIVGEALQIDTLTGPVVLDGGSRVTLRKTASGTRLDVEIGAAHLTEERRDLKAGEWVEVGIGQAVLQSTDRPPPVPSVSPTSPPSPAPVDSAGGPAAGREPDARPQGPALAHLMVSPGDSLVIHDPHPPTVVGFGVSRCSGLAVLELGAKKRETVGRGRVTAAVPTGTHRYRLRCDGDATPFAEGRLSVAPDAGNRRLSKTAPMNRIDTDGRRYTILYQSLLPKVSVSWPNPPQRGPFAVTLDTQGRGQKRFASATPTLWLPTGALTEGSHELWFEAHGVQSRKTAVVVQFDNAAPTASISSPAERGFAPGAAVTVAGTALPGWTVSVEGRELPQDAQQRFSAEVVAPAGLGALVIRFSHPQRGVHYYLRKNSQ